MEIKVTGIKIFGAIAAIAPNTEPQVLISWGRVSSLNNIQDGDSFLENLIRQREHELLHEVKQLPMTVRQSTKDGADHHSYLELCMTETN